MQRWLGYLSSLALALALAGVVWVVAARQENPILRGRFSESIPVEVTAPPAGTRLWDPLNESVWVIIRAPKSSWDNLRRQSFQATVDISSLAPGLHDVPIVVRCSDPEVEIVERSPAKVSVRLEKLGEKDVPVRVEVLDAPPFGYYQPLPATAAPAVVRISGFATYVEQVAEAVVEVSVGGAKKSLELRRVPELRDAQHLPVETGREPYHRLEIQPGSVVVTIPIEQRRGFRDVSVRVVREGQPAPGYRISNVSVEPAIVTVVGSPSIIEALPGYVDTDPVNIEGATSDVVAKAGLQVPESVSVLDVQAVLVNIAITPIESSLTVQRPVEIRGLQPGLTAVASPDSVDIILSGPLPTLEALRPEAVRVFVDLLDLQPGIHQIKPQVIAPERLKVESIVPEAVEVNISRLPTPTPTPTPTATLTVTVTPTSTPEITVTWPITVTPMVTPGMPFATATPTATATFTATAVPTGTLNAGLHPPPPAPEGGPQ